MMTEKNNGCPAFPSANNVVSGDSVTAGHPGLSLRDYFAAKAMQGFISGAMADPTVIEAMSNIAKKRGIKSEAYIAEKAYEQADAMLEARK